MSIHKPVNDVATESLATPWDTYGRQAYRYARCLAGSHEGAVELQRRVSLRPAKRGPDDPLLWLRRALTQEAEGHAADAEARPGTFDWVLADLPMGRKTVWILREIERLSHEEIGLIVGCSAATSRTRHHRAKESVDRKRGSHWTAMLEEVREWDAPPVVEVPQVIPFDRKRRRRTTVLRLAGASMAAAGLILITRPAGAGHSSLEFSPANPQRGDIIEVTYRPRGRFVGRDRLVLRGRLRTANKLYLDLTVVPKPITVLTKRGRAYSGSFVLSDSVVYGAFAVEDERAEEVDSDGGRLWDLLTDEYAALAQLRNDLSGRDWGRYYRIAREATERFPYSPDAWARRGIVELRFDGDSVLPQYRQQYEALRNVRDTTVEAIAGLYWYALAVLGDSTESSVWETRLRAMDSLHPYLAEQQVLPPWIIRRLSETMQQYADREVGVTDSTVWASSRSQPLPDVPGLKDLLSDRVTVIAQWTRFSRNAGEILADVEQLRGDVQQAGGDLVLLTQDRTDPPTAIPFVHDPNGILGRAFNAFGQYHYAVVDQTGRVRFHHEMIEPVLLQVTALQAVNADR